MSGERWFQVLAVTFAVLNLTCAAVIVHLLWTVRWPPWPTTLVLAMFILTGALGILAAVRVRREGRVLWWSAVAISLAEELESIRRGFDQRGLDLYAGLLVIVVFVAISIPLLRTVHQRSEQRATRRGSESS